MSTINKDKEIFNVVEIKSNEVRIIYLEYFSS